MEHFTMANILKIALACFLFVFLVTGFVIVAEYSDKAINLKYMQEEAKIPYGNHAEFEVLIGSKNTGEVIHAVLRVKDEDIPKFFEGHAWTLLPPPLPGGDK